MLLANAYSSADHSLYWFSGAVDGSNQPNGLIGATPVQTIAGWGTNVAAPVDACTYKMNGAACLDSDLCNGAETCGMGLCRAGTPLNCDDTNVCTVDTCTSAGGCQHAAGNAGTVCRSAGGPCDIAEACTGSASACPTDAKQPSTYVCRSSSGPCDVAATCTGSSVTCPSNTVAPATTVCRSSAGPCDIADHCNGTDTTCADAKVAAGTVCRPPAGDCDVADVCDANGACSPTDAVVAAGTVCRSAGGPCDVPEACDGIHKTCPRDGFAPPSQVCWSPPSWTCALAKTCSGTSPQCL